MSSPLEFDHSVAERTATLLGSQLEARLQMLRTWQPTRYGEGSGADGPAESVGPPVPPTDVLIRQLQQVLEMHERDRPSDQACE